MTEAVRVRVSRQTASELWGPRWDHRGTDSNGKYLRSRRVGAEAEADLEVLRQRLLDAGLPNPEVQE